jgi:hypothetical protein
MQKFDFTSDDGNKKCLDEIVYLFIQRNDPKGISNLAKRTECNFQKN